METKDIKFKKIITDLETIIAYQNSLIFTLDNTVEAQNYRMWWYNDFINEYDGQLLEIGKEETNKYRTFIKFVCYEAKEEPKTDA